MAPEHPDWSGLQAVDETSPKEATRVANEKELSPRQPLDHYSKDKFLRPGSAHKQTVPDWEHNQKIIGSAHYGGGVAGGYGMEEKQLQDRDSTTLGGGGSGPQSPIDSAAAAARQRSRRRLYILVGVIALIVALAIAIPCGVVLSQKAKNDAAAAEPAPATTGAPSGPAAAHNGSRFNSIMPTVGGDRLWFFWQNTQGDIRLSKLDGAGKWGDSVSLPPKQTPALGTPLAAAIHYTSALKTGLNHLVYFTEDGYYADLTNDPTKDDEWEDGGLYKMLRSGPNDPHFQMAWGIMVNGTAYLYEGGGRSGLWNTFTYDATKRTWTDEEHIFGNTSAYGGIAVQQGHYLSTMRIVTPESTIVSYFRNETSASDGKWRQDNDHVLDGVHANSSLAAPHLHGDGTLVYYQAPNASIGLAQVASLDVNAEWKSRSDLAIPALVGTSLQLAVTSDGTTNLFLQEKGDEVTHYSGSAADLRKVGALPL